jgi:CheY-like chemotaxis protein
MSTSRHDLNNLITVIVNYAYLAREALPPDHPARAELAEIERAAQRAAALWGADPAALTPELPAAPEADAAPTILVAEDDDALRRLTLRLLERGGYRVLAAPTPVQALDTCRAHDGPIDVLLTDVLMPAMTGDALAAEVRALYPEAGVVYMSGAGMPPGVVGAVHLPKPFTSAGLLAAIESALSSTVPRGGRGSR